MLTSLLGQIRIFYVMARDRMLPPSVAKVDPRFRTPLRTTLVTGGIVTVFAAIFPLTDLLLLVNIGTLVAFAIVCIGVLVLRYTHPEATRPFRAPLLPIFAVAGAATCLYLVMRLDPHTWIRYGVWFLIGVARLWAVRLLAFAPAYGDRTAARLTAREIYEVERNRRFRRGVLQVQPRAGGRQ